MRLTRLAPQEHVLTVAMHHIIADARSLDLFYEELLSTYRALTTGSSARPAPNAVHYGDFARDQAERLARGELEPHITFWKEQLRDLPQVMLNPASSAPRAASGPARSVQRHLSESARLALSAVCRHNKLSSFIVLLSAYKLLIARTTGCDDVSIITPISGRTFPEAERMIGVFMSSVVVRAKVAMRESGELLFRRVKQRVAHSIEHQEISLEVLEGALRSRRDRSLALERLPAIAFNHLRVGAGPAGETRDIGSVEAIEIGRTRAVFDLMMIATETADQVTLKLEYREDRFTPEQAERLIGDYEGLLECLCERPHAPLRELGNCDGDTVLAKSAQAVRFVALTPGQWHALDVSMLAGHTGAQVASLYLALSQRVTPIELSHAIAQLREAVPYLRGHIVRSDNARAPAWVCAISQPSAQADSPLRLHPHGVSADLTVSEAMAELADPATVHEWLVVARQGTDPDTVIELRLVAREPGLSAIQLPPLARALDAALNGREPSTALLSRLALAPGAASPAAVAGASLRLTPLRSTPYPRDPGADHAPGSLVEERLVLSTPELSTLRASSDAHGVDVDAWLRLAFGILVGSHTRAEADFQISYADMREQGAELGFLVFSADFTASNTATPQLLSSMLRVSREDAHALHAEDRWCSNELDFVWLASGPDTHSLRVRPPAGQVVVTAQHSKGKLTLALSYVAETLSDRKLLPRLVSVATQLAEGWPPGEVCLLLKGEHEAYTAPPGQEQAQGVGLGHFVERWARDTPARVALRSGEHTLNYGELDDRAARLARCLTERGAKPGSIIAVLLPRSERLLVTLLAVLKLGGTYLPLDSRYPRERLGRMLAQANATLAISEPSLTHLLDAVSTKTLCLETLWSELDEVTPLPPRKCAPRDTAYVIFTSGSTGEPKGVAVSHEAAFNFLASVAAELGMNANDVLLSVTTIAFDISVLELFLPLFVGACVVIANEATVVDGARLLKDVQRHQVTYLQATPHTWELLLEAGLCRQEPLIALSGGEAMPPSLAERLLPQVSALWNMYGPTEATVWVTAHRIASATPIVPIGKPLAGAALHVLDRAGRVVPPGTTGEIYINGVCLADGYVNNAEQTQARFVSVRAADRSLTRAYRTGDLGGVDSRGTFYCLGRMDRQIKLRGHRIELAEIEHAIRQCAGVSECVVALEQGGTNDARLSAYVRTERNGTPNEAELRAALKQTLPSYAVPQRILPVAELPRLANGKLDLAGLAQLATPAHDSVTLPASSLEATLVTIWETVIGSKGFGVRDSFFDVGGHSLLLLQIQRKIETEIGIRVEVVDLFTHSTVEKLARHLDRKKPRAAAIISVQPKRDTSGSTDIAIIGMSGVFPGAPELATLWTNLRTGVESITQLDRHTLRKAGVPAALIDDPRYVCAAPLLPDADMFDATLFRFTPREARRLDPQHRLLLQCAYAALEDAACEPRSIADRVGLFAGVGFSYYLLHQVLSQKNTLIEESPLELLYANDKDYAATRIAYKLNLRGPCLTVGTACSTGLVAVHQACRSLHAFDCDVALAGASRVAVPQQRGYLRAEGGILSSDGHCRAFDARADGTLFGNGVGVVALKRLDDALRDRDSIYCVVKGSAVNNDGSDKVGFTAPATNGQVRVLRDAYRNAGIDPRSIQYVEAHGTGTRMGDAIEIAALHEAICSEGRPAERIAVGSIKTNFGHLDTAAGMAGLIKTVLALHHRVIPPTVHFERANPALQLERTPFYINQAAVPWPDGPAGRRAGVSSFGIGGTNAHVVLEAFSAPPRTQEWSARPELLVISGATADAVRSSGQRIGTHLSDIPCNVTDAAHTLRIGRPSLKLRAFVVAEHAADAARALCDLQSVSAGDEATPSLVLMFPGQGTAYRGMADALRDREPTFGARFDAGLAIASDLLHINLQDLILGEPQRGRPAELDTLHAQPALFALEVALAELMGSWGLTPNAVLGHSLGELSAAAVAGVFSFEDGMRAVVARATAMQACGEGRMLAALAGPAEVTPYLVPGCSVSALNATDVTVIGGPPEALLQTQRALESARIGIRPLAVNRAFHTEAMEPALGALLEAFSRIALHPPRLPLVSTVTGTWLTHEQAQSPSYWSAQARKPVQFAKAASTVLSDGRTTMLEMGPGAGLSTLLRRLGNQQLQTVTTLPDALHAERSVKTVLHAVGELWQRGHLADWATFGVGEERPPARVHLPTYPFAREQHWYTASEPSLSPVERLPQEEWTYEPSFRRKSLTRRTDSESLGSTLILGGPRSYLLSETLADALHAQGQEVVIAHKSSSSWLGKSAARALDGESRNVFSDLIATTTPPITRVIHLWALERSANAQERRSDAFHSLMHLTQALSRGTERGQMIVVTDGVHSIDGREELDPIQALALGATRVLANELTGVSVCTVDLPQVQAQEDIDSSACAILQELAGDLTDPCVAYRGRFRWIPSFERSAIAAHAAPLGSAPVVLITGAAGGLGSALAESFGRVQNAHLVLVARSWEAAPAAPLPRPGEGSVEVVLEDADVTDENAMAEVIARAYARFGRIDVVLHAAGCADGKLALFQDRAHAERVLSPKVDGARVLVDLLSTRKVSSLVFFSSVTAVTGDPGQLAYCAANCFLDALAEESRGRGIPAISIAWDTWSELGMAVRAEVPDALRRVHMERLRLGIRTEEGISLLERLVQVDRARTVVSTIALEERLARAEATRAQARPSALQLPASTATDSRDEQPLLERVTGLWRASFGHDRIGPDDDFFALGGSSLAAVQLADALERALHMRVHPDALLRHPTIRTLVSYLENSEAGDTNARQGGALVRLRDGDKRRPPLFLVHPVGGEVFVYRELAQRLPEGQRIYGVRQTEPGGSRSVEQIAQAYLEQMRTMSPRGPYYLAGSSFGGTLAFEIAQQLGTLGERVAFLALLDTPDGAQVEHLLESELDVLVYLSSHLPPEVGLGQHELRAVPDQERLRYFLSKAAPLGLPAQFDEDRLRQYVATFRANDRAMRAYEPRRYEGPILFVKASERRERYDPSSPESAWLARCGELEMVTCPGNHLTMHEPPHVAVLARILGTRLQLALPRTQEFSAVDFS